MYCYLETVQGEIIRDDFEFDSNNAIENYIKNISKYYITNISQYIDKENIRSWWGEDE